MPRLSCLSRAALAAALCAPVSAGDLLVEVHGTVLANFYSSGPLAPANAGDAAVLRAWVTTPGTVTNPGHTAEYTLDMAATSLSAGPANLGLDTNGFQFLEVFNDNPTTDGFRILQAPTALVGATLRWDAFNLSGTVLQSVDLTQEAGTHPVSLFPTVLWSVNGGGGDMILLMERVVIRPPGGLVGQEYCTPAIPNTTGVGAVAFGLGSEVVSDNQLAIITTNLPPGQFGYLLAARTGAFIPGAGGSLGTLCLASPIGRFNAQIGASSPAGELTVVIDLGQMPQPAGPVAVVAGDTWNFQLWYRDWIPGTGAVSNFSSAVEVDFQ